MSKNQLRRKAMLPTEILKSEHRVIEQVLDVLERIANRVSNDKEFDAQSAGEAIDFFRNFADRCHHGKEESELFPMLESKGFDRDSGPTGVMCQEHEEGRLLIKGMAEAVEAGANDAEAAKRFVKYARGYVQLLRMHIEKEDHCLFSMADQAFSPADQEELLRRFEHVELEDMGSGTHEKFLQLANTLAARYGVARAAQSAGCACSHHH
jgi:hemerythrin-like domain-containing protein